VLVRAVGRLAPERRPEVVLVGEGPERPRLERLAAERRVRLRLPGALPPAEVGAWLGASDLFVHPCRSLPGGRTEGLPVAVREALAAGLPVLASASGGLPELAAAGHRVNLIPPDSPAALAAALARLAL
jgi:glycosyltransferase involved in cell wall biosynthesis